jgi:hypothetical protein
MIYLTPPSTQPVRDMITAGLLGAIATPKQGNRIHPGWIWCADNGCFGQGYPGDGAFVRWLTKLQPLIPGCLFAAAPDVVGDAHATLKRSRPLLPAIRSLGYPAAFVAQNGVTLRTVPWDDCAAVFIGGDDEFKGSTAARDVVDEARARGMAVHMGRVNTFGRLKLAASMGCDSADGRSLALFPQNLGQMLRWLRDNHIQQEVLW